MTMPWVITGGTESGIMKLVGQAIKKSSEETGIATPLIGVAPWGIISERDHFEAGGIGNGPKRRSYEYGSHKDPPEVDPAHSHSLDRNHTHFLLVDDGTAGTAAYASEVKFRGQLENEMCCTCFGLDDDGDALPNPPLVLIVVGGGPGTFQTVSTCHISHPVLCALKTAC